MEAIETKEETCDGGFDLSNHKKLTEEKFNNVDVEELLARNDAYIPRRRRPLYEAPEFIKRLNAFEEVKAGTTVVFECKYKSFPKSTVKWYKDDVEITEDNRYEKESEGSGDLRLIIRDCSKADEGAYKCKAENIEGVASSTGYLSVTGKMTDRPLSAQPRKNNSGHIISAAPPLRTILEQKSVEEREAEALQHQPASPLQNFLKDHRSRTWPLSYMGYGGRPGQAEHSKSYDHIENDVSTGVNDDVGSESDSDTSVDSQSDLLEEEKVKFTLKSPSSKQTKKVVENGKIPGSDSDIIDVGAQVKEGDQEAHIDDDTSDEPVKVESMIIVNRTKLAELGLSGVYEPGMGRLDGAPNWEDNVREQGHRAPGLLTRSANVDHNDEQIALSADADQNQENDNVPVVISTTTKDAKPTVSLPNFANILDHLQFPNLYYMLFLSGVTFWAAGWQVSPLLVILFVAFVSLISFRFLPES